MYLWHHGRCLTHDALLHASHDGVAHRQLVGGVVTKHQFELDVAQQVAADLGPGATRQTEFLVEADGCYNLVGVGVVVVDTLYDAHLVAVGIDGAGHGESADVVELDVVGVVAGEQRQPLEELHADKQDDDADNGNECYLYFFCEKLHLNFFNFDNFSNFFNFDNFSNFFNFDNFSISCSYSTPDGPRGCSCAHHFGRRR